MTIPTDKPIKTEDELIRELKNCFLICNPNYYSEKEAFRLKFLLVLLLLSLTFALILIACDFFSFSMIAIVEFSAVIFGGVILAYLKYRKLRKKQLKVLRRVIYLWQKKHSNVCVSPKDKAAQSRS